ncbi:phasin family protein [uncultured Tateyamaria sp.]|uniref:phasin family protein n=1 Tax=Tateyamaria sp. 1078 TaxID=3417464 RepID=UPI002607E36A|nr:phasin family protein [uncultured Tateyamaria sp.]
MTDTTDATPVPGSVAPAMAPLLLAWQAAGLGPLVWLAPTVVERMSDMGSAWLTFVADRVQQDVALQHGLLHAQSPADVQALQLDFLRKAVAQYSAETDKMLELGTHLFDPAIPDTGTGTSTDIDNVNV